MNNILTLLITLNVCLINFLILDIFQLINNILIKVEYYDYTQKKQNLNSIQCQLNCNEEINTIKSFYENISQFKNIYSFSPINIQQLNNKTCMILYNNIPTRYNKNTKVIYLTSYKDKRVFSMKSYILNDKCYWYITDMSPSLLIKKMNFY